MPTRGLAMAALPAFLLALVIASADAARAAACLPAPVRAPPDGQHWFYRTDRDANRKCWYLRAREVETTGSSPTRESPRPSAGRSDGGLALSEADQEKLFDEFLRWRDQQRPAR